MTRTHFQQFYVQPENIFGNHFILSGEEFVHAVKVLRKSVGETISAVDGCGHLFEGKIQSIESKLLKVGISAKQTNVGEPKLFLRLAQAVPKGTGFDYVIEKGTEIGLSAIQPIITHRSIVDPINRIPRWKSKALTAMKQCGRSRCPDILEPLDYNIVLEKYQRDLVFIAHESYADNLMDLSKRIVNASRVTLFIGPEGGFTEQEFNLAREMGAIPMNLGPRRLRSDTAGLVGAVKLLTAANEL